MVRHMFAGGNTPNGFFSYFDNILPFRDANRTIYIKGGSGTGKSSFMKKIGEHFEKKELDVEYMHCSNDIDSIDGVCIPQAKISLVDATAPHVADPVVPGAVDCIMNFADFLDGKELENYRNELLSLITEKKAFFEKAYRYLSGAYSIYLNNTSIYKNALDCGKLHLEIYNVTTDLFNCTTVNTKIASNRKLFSTAITPSGIVNFTSNIINDNHLYILQGNDGCGMDIMLKKIQQEANLHGFYTESYYCSLNPSKIEHLIVPDLKLAFSTNNNYHSITLKPYKQINFMDFCNQDIIQKHEEEIAYNYKIFDDLLQSAMNTITDSKELHNKIEEIYIKHMNFDSLNKLLYKTIDSLYCYMP